MFAPIFNALGAGYTTHQVLNYISKRFPKYANYINNAALAGYAGNTILKSLNSEDNSDNADAYLTENEWLKRDNQRKRRKERLAVAGGIAGTAALAAGAGSLLASRGAINPTQIIMPGGIPRPPPIPGATINVTPNPVNPNQGGGGIANRRPVQLTNQQKQVTQQATSPISPAPPISPTTKSSLITPAIITPPYEHNPQKNIDLIKNINEEKRIGEVVKSGLEPIAVAQVLREILPKSKIAILDRATGGFDQAIIDFTEFKNSEIQKAESQSARKRGLEGFNIKKSLAQKEKERFNEHYPKTIMPPLIQAQQIGSADLGIEDKVIPEILVPSKESERAIKAAKNLGSGDEQKVKQATFVQKELKPLSASKRLDFKDFSIPNYKYSDESDEDFNNRKIIYGAIKKGANALMQGKSFLDFPVNEEAIKARGGYSTAADVLRFMAGIPNIYDPLLDDAEKEELSNALLESEQLRTEGLKPAASGDRDIYGAQMTPNLVWNLLLSVEPRLASIEKPPSVKGYKMAKNGKMGTAELRRFLTHAVYGTLSGRTISTELSEKIGRISSAANSIDVLSNAAKLGKLEKMHEELNRIWNNDKELFDLMDFELDDFLLTDEGKRLKLEKESANKKSDAAFQASETRKRNKEKKEQNEN